MNFGKSISHLESRYEGLLYAMIVTNYNTFNSSSRMDEDQGGSGSDPIVIESETGGYTEQDIEQHIESEMVSAAIQQSLEMPNLVSCVQLCPCKKNVLLI